MGLCDQQAFRASKVAAVYGFDLFAQLSDKRIHVVRVLLPVFNDRRSAGLWPAECSGNGSREVRIGAARRNGNF